MSYQLKLHAPLIRVNGLFSINSLKEAVLCRFVIGNKNFYWLNKADDCSITDLLFS
jgi:hypothetical protein